MKLSPSHQPAPQDCPQSRTIGKLDRLSMQLVRVLIQQPYHRDLTLGPTAGPQLFRAMFVLFKAAEVGFVDLDWTSKRSLFDVCAMEDVLEVYHREFEDTEVLVCLDETSKQLVGETRQPLPPRPGYARAYDYEYQRNGVSNLFMLFAPLEGWCRVEITQRRTKSDWARVVRKLVDEDYADKERIVLVMDNLNTHHPARGL